MFILKGVEQYVHISQPQCRGKYAARNRTLLLCSNKCTSKCLGEEPLNKELSSCSVEELRFKSDVNVNNKMKQLQYITNTNMMSRIFKKPYSLYTIHHNNSFQLSKAKSVVNITSKQTNNTYLRHKILNKTTNTHSHSVNDNSRMQHLNNSKALCFHQLFEKNTKNVNSEEATKRHHKQINPFHAQQQLMQHRNKSNIFPYNNSDNTFHCTSASNELNEERFSRIFESKSDISTLPSHKYATLVNHESNSYYIYNPSKKNTTALTKNEIVSNTVKRNVTSKNQIVGDYVNQIRIFSNKENKEYMRFYNRNPRCFRIKRNISANISDLYGTYRSLCEWPFKKCV